MKRFENPSYKKIRKAGLLKGSIMIQFENGDEVSIPLNKILKESDIINNSINLFYEGHQIKLKGELFDLEIPWDRIRALTDEEFNNYLTSFAEKSAKKVGRKLKYLRERKGILAKDIAKKTGLTTQTISRIEQGHTDVTFSNLKKILASMGHNLLDLAKLEESEFYQISYSKLISNLEKIGLSEVFLKTRLLPDNVTKRITRNIQSISLKNKSEIETYIQTILNISPSEIWGDTDIKLDHSYYSLAYFKKPKLLKKNQIIAYSNYAYFLAKIITKSCPISKDIELPSDVNELKKSLKNYGEFGFENLLKFIWELGISVIPLNDPGIFHGACWSINGRKVIILKNKHQTHSRWIFDLLHEFYHVLVDLDEEDGDSTILEFEEIPMFEPKNNQKEREANNFAKLILFEQDVDKLAQRCVKNAGNDLRMLKKSLDKLSTEENIRKDVFADYLAFRLSAEGHNWWSTAFKFQILDPNPFDIAKKYLNSKINFNKLNIMEKNVIKNAYK